MDSTDRVHILVSCWTLAILSTLIISAIVKYLKSKIPVMQTSYDLICCDLAYMTILTTYRIAFLYTISLLCGPFSSWTSDRVSKINFFFFLLPFSATLINALFRYVAIVWTFSWDQIEDSTLVFVTRLATFGLTFTAWIYDWKLGKNGGLFYRLLSGNLTW
jgi:hypothetical protein